MSKHASSSTESMLITSHDSKLHPIPTRRMSSSSKGSKSKLHKRKSKNIHSKKRLRARMKRKKDNNSDRSSDIESNTEDTSPFGFKQENIIQLPVDEEDDNVMDDIYKYRQLPNMEDFSEAVSF